MLIDDFNDDFRGLPLDRRMGVLDVREGVGLGGLIGLMVAEGRVSVICTGVVGDKGECPGEERGKGTLVVGNDRRAALCLSFNGGGT